ncbi:MAG TPA: M55 family metallopeptidase [bacterium]|nr:M55 family metallopeptidase [bacterium]
MKVYISADMEGATGIAVKAQVVEGHPGYERARRLLTGDVSAAVAGAFDAGATDVLVNDSHFLMTNILIDELDPRARLITGRNKALAQMQGLDRSFDAVFYVAYHASVGMQDAVINHTYLGKAVREIRRNGRPAGEAEINSGIAGYFGVPVVLVTGDDKVVAETRAALGTIEGAVVKKALDRYVADSLSPQASAALIRETACRALTRVKEFSPPAVPSPTTFEIDFMSTAEAAITTLFPCVERRGPRTVAVTDRDYLRAFKALYGCLLLGNTMADEIFG